MNTIVNAVLVPVEASLMAILAVTLIYASIRLFRRRADVMSVVFLLVAVLFLFAITMPMLLGSMGDQVGQLICKSPECSHTVAHVDF